MSENKALTRIKNSIQRLEHHQQKTSIQIDLLNGAYEETVRMLYELKKIRDATIKQDPTRQGEKDETLYEKQTRTCK